MAATRVLSAGERYWAAQLPGDRRSNRRGPHSGPCTAATEQGSTGNVSHRTKRLKPQALHRLLHGRNIHAVVGRSPRIRIAAFSCICIDSADDHSVCPGTCDCGCQSLCKVCQNEGAIVLQHLLNIANCGAHLWSCGRDSPVVQHAVHDAPRRGRIQDGRITGIVPNQRLDSHAGSGSVRQDHCRAGDPANRTLILSDHWNVVSNNSHQSVSIWKCETRRTWTIIRTQAVRLRSNCVEFPES